MAATGYSGGTAPDSHRLPVGATAARHMLIDDGIVGDIDAAGNSASVKVASAAVGERMQNRLRRPQLAWPRA